MEEKDYKGAFDLLKGAKSDEDFINAFIYLIKGLLYKRNTFVKSSQNDQLRNVFFDKIRNKIVDMCSRGNIDVRDIEYIGCGHTSLAFRIGDEVLKIGKTDNDRQRKRDYRCLIPVISDECFKVDDREFYTMEVTPYVDTSDISLDDVYSSYCDLRNLGYIWNDPKEENAGRIVKDIKVGDREYKAGDIVIIDLEDIAYVGEETSDEVLEEISMMSYNRNTYNFEVRYLESKGKTK